jgi:hypothetical protein
VLNKRVYLIWKFPEYCTSYHQDTHVLPHFTLYNQCSGRSVFHFLPVLVGLFMTYTGRTHGCVGRGWLLLLLLRPLPPPLLPPPLLLVAETPLPHDAASPPPFSVCFLIPPPPSFIHSQ